MSITAKECFDAYSAAVGGTTWDGKPIPAYEDTGEKVQAGWEAVAAAANASFDWIMPKPSGLIFGRGPDSRDVSASGGSGGSAT